MKTVLLAIIVTVLGVAAGGAAAFATAQLTGTGSKAAAAHALPHPEPPIFIPTGRILAPLVFPNGQLAGYVIFEVQIEVATDKAEYVKERLPLLFHAINMRTYRTPMASGPNGMLPDLSVFRTVLMTSATEAFGAGVVKRAAITQAMPV